MQGFIVLFYNHEYSCSGHYNTLSILSTFTCVNFQQSRTDVTILKNEETKLHGYQLAKDQVLWFILFSMLLFKLIKCYIRGRQGDLPSKFSQ